MVRDVEWGCGSVRSKLKDMYIYTCTQLKYDLYSVL